MPRLRPLLAALGLPAAAAAIAACSSAQGRGAVPAPALAGALGAAAGRAPADKAACGAGAAEALARTVGTVAQRIYGNELASAETQRDMRQVEGYAPLLAALSSGTRAAVREAVTSLVYSHTHVVRLRVTRGREVLADVGGPYILAPVGGTLRSGARALARYALSVQDDSGYVKLVARFLGVQLVLSAGGRALPVEGAVAPGPASIPDHGPVSYRGRRYEAYSFDARAFPAGTLRVSLLVPVASALQARPCGAIKVAELGEVARRISRRFSLGAATFSDYIRTTTPLTHGLLYIRSGAQLLGAGTGGAPRALPDAGTVSWRGTRYSVSSFTAPAEGGQARIYQLVRP